jgi:RNA polymerase sigma-70 factor (ECF subfamily)
LRNAFFSEHRRRKFEVADPDGTFASSRSVDPSQEHCLHLRDLEAALSRLTAEHREALSLIAVEGLSYREAAVLTHCAVGTVKSRVCRARIRLRELLLL